MLLPRGIDGERFEHTCRGILDELAPEEGIRGIPIEDALQNILFHEGVSERETVAEQKNRENRVVDGYASDGGSFTTLCGVLEHDLRNRPAEKRRLRGLAALQQLIHVAGIRFGRFIGRILGFMEKLGVGLLRRGGGGSFVGEEVGKRDFFVVAEKPVAQRLREGGKTEPPRDPAGDDAPPPR